MFYFKHYLSTPLYTIYEVMESYVIMLRTKALEFEVSQDYEWTFVENVSHFFLYSQSMM